MADQSATRAQRFRGAIRGLTFTQWILIFIAVLLMQNLRLQGEISERITDLESTVQSEGSNTRGEVDEVKSNLDDVKTDVEEIKNDMP